MKRVYTSPEMHWTPICSSRAVADVCWGYANNHKPFYYNTYGTGYAELYAVGGACTREVQFEVKYYPENMSAAEKAAADEDMQRVIAQVMASMPNKPTPFKGSPFVTDPDTSWS